MACIAIRFCHLKCVSLLRFDGFCYHTWQRTALYDLQMVMPCVEVQHIKRSQQTSFLSTDDTNRLLPVLCCLTVVTI